VYAISGCSSIFLLNSLILHLYLFQVLCKIIDTIIYNAHVASISLAEAFFVCLISNCEAEKPSLQQFFHIVPSLCKFVYACHEAFFTLSSYADTANSDKIKKCENQ